MLGNSSNAKQQYGTIPAANENSDLSLSSRRMSSNLADAERLLRLVQTKPTVADAIGAAELNMTDGKVEFGNASFGYDE